MWVPSPATALMDSRQSFSALLQRLWGPPGGFNSMVLVAVEK